MDFDYTLDASNRLTNVTYADGTGALSGSADFHAFGAVRSSTGSPGAFRFTGEQSDPETGFTYLRARYYDPAVGRLGAVDTVIPNAPGTQGYNQYAYVANNPTTWIDPTGHYAAAAAPRPHAAGGAVSDSLAPYAVAAGGGGKGVLASGVERCKRMNSTSTKGPGHRTTAFLRWSYGQVELDYMSCLYE
jgi:RHS repeat-associated protein